jgi:long-chain fatty acid transport protein
MKHPTQLALIGSALACGAGLPLSSQADGQIKIRDETWGFGANAGVLITPRAGTRIGVTYLSPVALDFEDRPGFSNLGGPGGALFDDPPQLDLGVTAPQSVMLSANHELSPKWALLANVGWQNRIGRICDLCTKVLNYPSAWR